MDALYHLMPAIGVHVLNKCVYPTLRILTLWIEAPITHQRSLLILLWATIEQMHHNVSSVDNYPCEDEYPDTVEASDTVEY